jgi:hypothetical protein
MAGTAKPRKKFRVAVSGNTVMAAKFSRSTSAMRRRNTTRRCTAHASTLSTISMFPGSDFGAMGDVVALSAEDITEGPLAGRTALMRRSNHLSA